MLWLHFFYIRVFTAETISSMLINSVIKHVSLFNHDISLICHNLLKTPTKILCTLVQVFNALVKYLFSILFSTVKKSS